ncbi:methyltransferase domain-containing protein [Akkermansiaceae bacterium]|jgi:putative 4-mercaptohistidine N1-methyltranferase|nr:methyltransferase domain-containing protein [Verrucomicrobiota bacterium]MDA7507168.1 methyltransferase domain-containing protein [Akkermansiaceae bacterium]MDA7611008.1 methyltransferase domain-containing protein [bacterium]MBT6167400.1 methyltransferase domain-containing protein [Verrucomicrobiota bacterium]MBT6398234.1 methyltransferase domain-containing protein [Verrucomicrobiota bacterium]
MADVYETDRYVGEYLLFHYGKPKEILPWEHGPAAALDFPVRTVGYFAKGSVGRSLDVGCAVGRSSFELGRTSSEVIGIDFSRAFITAAEKIGAGQTLSCQRLEEAGEVTTVNVSRPGGTDGGGITFEVGDAMNLRDELGKFDRVHAANLVCRLPEPRRFLSKLASLVRNGGELVLATPCTWLEEFTQKENWPEGRTLDWLKKELGNDFELIEVADEPFLIRETARKFQWTVSMVTKWKRVER